MSIPEDIAGKIDIRAVSETLRRLFNCCSWSIITFLIIFHLLGNIDSFSGYCLLKSSTS